MVCNCSILNTHELFYVLMIIVGMCLVIATMEYACIHDHHIYKDSYQILENVGLQVRR